MGKKKYCAILIVLTIGILKSYSQDTISSIAPIPDEVNYINRPSLSDTLAVEPVSNDSVLQAAPVKKENVFKKFFNQLFKGNKDKTHERPIDLSFVVFPFYSQEASVGLGGVVTALYRIDRTDSIIQPSDLQFFANVTLKGEYKISIGGNNHFNRKSRIHYYAQFYNKPLDFWGISYDACKVNEKSVYTRRLFNIEADYVYNITDNLHIGPSLNMGYTYISRLGNESYLEGQALSYWLTGIGASLVYDTRDFIPNPKRGLYIALQELIYPRFLGTASKDVFKTTLT
ncbi:MAG: BamA/TamA family outer membrane protein, partial [Muribaculaceae bacterium]|nr:BamA/TamA family outer membrane protein [Muribaculaceae bacterium]